MDLGLNDALAKAFVSLGFEDPTEIQKLAIPAILAGRDAYVSSATGTGKTFAYLAPILDSLLSSAEDSPASVQAIVVAPTHDLAVQIEREAGRLAEAAGFKLRAMCALGSVPLKRQLSRLADKPQLIVGSAGRIRDLALGRYIDLSSCRWAVLDEADRLFENEAIDVTTELLSALPDACGRLLVSASLPNRTVDRSAAWFRNPLRLIVDPSEALRTSIEHWCFHSVSRSKLDFLRRFEAAVKPERCLLFASSNASIFNIQKRLDYLGFPAVVLKSDKEGEERKNALADFTSGAARWMITTDLGARGLDLPDVSHVISFDLPEEPTVYMHRAGRTGRAGKRGVSVTLADLVELKRASKIAVRYGFSFVCKILDSGIVHDIEPENFFAIAEEEEAARKDVKLEGTKRPESGRRRRPVGTSVGERPRRPPAEGGYRSAMEPNRQPARQPSQPPRRDRPRQSPKPGRPQPLAGQQGRSPVAAPAGSPNGTPNNPPNGTPNGIPNGTPNGNQPAKRKHRRRKGGPKDAQKPSAE